MDIFNWMTGAGFLFAIIGGLLTMILPLLVIGGLVWHLARRQQKIHAVRQDAQNWEATSGVILVSTVQARRVGKTRTEVPLVIYQYQVNGQTFQGHTIRAGDQLGGIRVPGEAQATVLRYPVGATVQVLYNPQNPSESAMER